jgi:lysophospholipase L1-like esterase
VSGCRLGVLAFGDSITNGGGELQWGVALQSWALWAARGLGLPYSGFAVDGARVGDVLAEQLPAVPAGARYDLGCLYVGANDVRAPDWDRAAFERSHRAVLAFLGERCDRVLTATVPLDLGRPRAGAKVHEANAAIEASAAAAGALVVDLRGFGARNRVMADHVHPTAFGQVAIAERALAVLAADGLPARVRPSSLIRYETTRWRRLRGDLTYAYRHSKVSAQAAVIGARAAWDRRRAAGSGTARSGT